MKKVICIAIFLTVLGFSTFSNAAFIIPVSHEANTDSRYPQTVFSGYTLEVGQSGGMPGDDSSTNVFGTQDAYLRFNLSNLIAPNLIPASVTNASLSFFQTNGTINVHSIAVYAPRGSWSDSTLTYANSPGYDNSALLFTAGEWGWGVNSYSSPLLNDIVLTWLQNPSFNYGMVIHAISSNWYIDRSDFIASTKNDMGQQAATLSFDLTTTPAPVPIPSTAFLLAPCFAVFVAIRRRFKK